jgi:ElaB/YqjD/DUF883 family membrane-anchored ribosome-binding protein
MFKKKIVSHWNYLLKSFGEISGKELRSITARVQKTVEAVAHQ